MIECVSLSNVQEFPLSKSKGPSVNALIAQHRLRHRSIIKRQDWNVPQYLGMEFDQYDNPAAKYLIYRDKEGVARGSSRFYPTTLPYMLEEKFPRFVTERQMPKSEDVWEGSRFCVDNTLPAEERKKIIQEIIVGYLETGMHFGLKAIVGIMYPAYWRSLFIKAGWDIEYMGDTLLLDDGYKSRSAWLPVNAETLEKVRETTGIQHNIVNFGETYEHKKAA